MKSKRSTNEKIQRNGVNLNEKKIKEIKNAIARELNYASKQNRQGAVDGLGYYKELNDLEALNAIYHYIKEMINMNYKGENLYGSKELKDLAYDENNARNRDAYANIRMDLSDCPDNIFVDHDFERNLTEELDLEKRYIDGGYNWDTALAQDEFQSYNPTYKKNKLGKP